MATAKQGQVVKIYDLRTLGYDQIHAQLQQISKDFEAIKKAKQDASAQLASAKDKADVDNYKNAIQDLKIKEQELRTQRQQMLNEAKLLQIQRQQEQQALKDTAKNTQAAAGSYQALYNQYKQLYQLVKATPKGQVVNFQGEILQFDQAIAKLKELAVAEQDFRRQFARDGLLVAEYTSGIIQAFERADLGQLIGGQLTKAEAALTGINQEFEQLKNEFNQAKQTGVGDLGAIEAKMIENRKEAINLTGQIETFKTNLKGAGSIGDTVTKGLASGFKNIKEQAGGFILAFVGIQTVFSKLESFGELATHEFEEMETTTARLKGSLQNLGRSGELEGLTKEVETLAERFRFLDQNEIRAATNNLVLYGKLTQDQIKELLPVIIDFATQQRKSLEESSEIFIKALEGQDRPLKKFGLNLKEASTEEGKFNVLTQDLGKRLAGTAADFDKSTSGAIARNKQAWKDLAEEVGVKVIPVLTAVGGVIVNFVGALLSIPFPVLIAGITAVTSALALYKAEQIRSYVVTQIATKQGLIYNAYLIAQRIATLAAAAATKIATAEIVLFNGAIRISPIGIFLTVLGAIIPALAVWGSRLREARKEQSALVEVNRAAAKSYRENVAEINSYIAIIKSAATSADTKRAALDKLIEKNKEFSGVIKNGVIDLEALAKAYDKVTKSIELQARAAASAELTAKKKADVTEVEIIRQTIEAAQATGERVAFDELSKSQQNIITQILGTPGSLQNIANEFLNLFGGGKSAEQQTKKLLDGLKKLEDFRVGQFDAYAKIQQQADAALAKFFEAKTVEAATFEVDIKELRTKLEKLNGEIQDFQGTAADLKKKIQERDELQKQLDALTKTAEKKTTGPTESKLSVEVKDSFKDIEAVRDELLAEEELKRKQNLEDEEKYLKQVLLINQIAIDQKLALLKGSNAEERKQISQLKLEKLNAEQDTNQKIFELRKNALKQQLDQQIAAIDLARDQQITDPNLSETKRAKIKTEADQKILALQLAFNEAIDALEKQLGLKSVENAKESAEAIKKTREAIFADQRAQTEAALKDAQIAGARSVTEFKNLMERLKLAIATSTNLSGARRTALLGAATKEEDLGILAREVESLQKQLPIYKDLLAQKVITDQQYQEFETTLFEKERQLREALLTGLGASIDKLKAFYKSLLDAGTITKEQYDKLIAGINATTQAGASKAAASIKSLKDLLSGAIADLLNIDTSTDQGKLLQGAIGEALVKTYALATKAMNDHFDAEKQRIQENLELQEQRLDMEKEQVESRAQSQAEIDSIEKQYAAKKKAAQKEAGEQLKRVKRSEAKIALATELVNIAVQASQYPFPASLIIGSILAAAALANYAIQIGAINREQFKYGGQPGTTRGQRTTQRAESRPVALPVKIFKKIFAKGGLPGSRDTQPAGGQISGAKIIKLPVLPTITQGAASHAANTTQTIPPGGIALQEPQIQQTKITLDDRQYPAPYIKQKNVVREIWTGIQRIFKLGGKPGITKASDTREQTTHLIERTTRSKENEILDRQRATNISQGTTITDGPPIDRTTEMPEPRKRNLLQRVYTRIIHFARGGQPGISKLPHESMQTATRNIQTTTNRTEKDTMQHRRSTTITDGKIDDRTAQMEPRDEKRTIIQRIWTRIRKFATGGQPGTKMPGNEIHNRYIDLNTNTTSNDLEEINKRKATNLIERTTQSKETNVIDRSTETKSHQATESQQLEEIERITRSKQSDIRTQEKRRTEKSIEESRQSDTSITDKKRIDRTTESTERRKRTWQDTRDEVITRIQRFFGFGGTAGEVPVRGGKFGGRPHSQGGTDFTFKKQDYNAEVDELAIIRTRNAPKNKRYMMIGTLMQIASGINYEGGGVDFHPGVQKKRFATGGILGSNLQAPFFVPSGNSQANNDAMIKELKAIQEKLDTQSATNMKVTKAINERIDKIKVEVLEKEITKAQNKEAIRSTIGTLL